MKLHNEVTVHYECTLRLTEAEMRALDHLNHSQDGALIATPRKRQGDREIPFRWR